MNRLIGAMLLAVPAIAATPAAARDASIRSLEMSAANDPRDGGAEIELANGYVRAGRTAQAAIAYRRALALDNVMMETRRGDPIWSHEVATRALAGQATFAAR